MKNNLIFNKIAAATILALALAWITNKIATETVRPEMPAKNSFLVDTGAAPAASTAAAAPAGPAPITPLLAAASPDAGAKYGKICGTCHSLGKGEAAKIGPNLYGIVGNHHAHMEGFNYSTAMQALHDQIWTFEALNQFLYSPRVTVPGTKMTFAGIKDDKDRANVIAWLRTLSDSPEPLPTK